LGGFRNRKPFVSHVGFSKNGLSGSLSSSRGKTFAVSRYSPQARSGIFFTAPQTAPAAWRLSEHRLAQAAGRIFGLMLFAAVFWTVPAAAQGVCSTEIEFTNPKPNVSGIGKLELNLFSTVSQPAGSCLPAEIRLMAAFYDADQDLICSGIIEAAGMQSNHVQSTNFEVWPFNLVEFVRLRIPTNPPPKRLFCMNPEGNIEVAKTDILRAASLRLRATILPKGGGVATSEIRMTFSLRPN
jgi:hypothetical protein